MKTPPDTANAVVHGSLAFGQLGTLRTVGLLGRWRPLCGHLRHARLANRHGYWLRRSSRNWLANRLAVPPGPRRGGMFGAGTGGGGLLPQTAASGNVSQPDPESLMKYPG
jgi:hypothetical protein